MVYYKKIFIILLLFLILFSFTYCFASEDVSLTAISGLAITPNSNAFTEVSSATTRYFYAEKGYKYTINLTGGTSTRIVTTANDIPAVNLPYTIISQIEPNQTYTFIPVDNCYVALSTSAFWTVTSDELEGLNSSISNLVENVGPNALWGVFGNGIDFIFVVVIVAFGLFIIFKLISGFSKGKSKI